MKTNGNTILITGGSSGIGLALATLFLQRDNNVIITGRDKAKLDAVRKQYPGIEVFHGDLTSMASLDELTVFIEQRHPNLNVLVNNAAVQYQYDFADGPGLTDRIDYEVSANLMAPMKLTALLLPTLLANTTSAIVNVSSGLFIAPKKSAPVYCATKAGLHTFSQTLRYQLEPRGVRVFEIVPPLVATPMTEGRGRGKISTSQLVNEFFRDFESDRYESYIGKAKLLRWLHRIAPGVVERMMKNG